MNNFIVRQSICHRPSLPLLFVMAKRPRPLCQSRLQPHGESWLRVAFYWHKESCHSTTLLCWIQQDRPRRCVSAVILIMQINSHQVRSHRCRSERKRRSKEGRRREKRWGEGENRTREGQGGVLEEQTASSTDKTGVSVRKWGWGERGSPASLTGWTLSTWRHSELRGLAAESYLTETRSLLPVSDSHSQMLDSAADGAGWSRKRRISLNSWMDLTDNLPPESLNLHQKSRNTQKKLDSSSTDTTRGQHFTSSCTGSKSVELKSSAVQTW